MKVIWLMLGLAALSLGAIGAFVPLLPTVPLILLAAFFFSQSSERLHDWLHNHPSFGPAIQNWNEHGAIDRRAKILASASIAAAVGFSLLLGLKPWILLLQAAILCAVLIFIWSRPEV